jgi:hypothetical protein
MKGVFEPPLPGTELYALSKYIQKSVLVTAAAQSNNNNNVGRQRVQAGVKERHWYMTSVRVSGVRTRVLC